MTGPSASHNCLTEKFPSLYAVSRYCVACSGELQRDTARAKFSALCVDVHDRTQTQVPRHIAHVTGRLLSYYFATITVARKCTRELGW
jgi:hypothetical protein